MSHPKSPLTRVLSGVATFALMVSGLTVGAVIGAAPAVAAEVVAYDSVPLSSPPSYASLGFQATSSDEVGDLVLLEPGTPRTLSSVTVGLTNWACQSDFTFDGTQWVPGGLPANECVSAPGSSFTHDITLNVYEADMSGATATKGALIGTLMQPVAVPFRPSATPGPNGVGAGECGVDNRRWYSSASGQCHNGFAFNATFDFSGLDLVLGDDVIVAVAYNTSSHGEVPNGNPGPYDSLNVSFADIDNVSVGTDENTDEMFWDTSFAGFYSDGGAGGTDTLRIDTGYTLDITGLVMEIRTDDALLDAPALTETINHVDVKSSENASTYTTWHEGKATPGYMVKPNGLNLGSPTPSTIINGTDVYTDALSAKVTEAQLRALIAQASVEVTSGSVTYQIPIHYGANVSSNFTTLRSLSLTSGVHDDFALTDTWATTRIIPGGVYNTTQFEAPLGDMISYLFDNFDNVWIAGYGVQADSLAVVPEFVWDDTTTTFVQPEAQACSPSPSLGATVTNLDSEGWTFGESRTQGVNEFVDGGLHVYTYGAAGSPDQRKAAGYHAINIPLSDVGIPSINFSDFDGVRPSLQLGIDLTGDGTWDGYIVGEPWYYNQPQPWDGDWSDAVFWTSKTNFGVAPGAGYPSLGTINDYLLANPDAKIVSYGYSLGSGVTGDAVITSIVVGCEITEFDASAPPAAGSTETINDHQIAPSESPATYTQWHEGYANAARAYSVKADGLHLGDGTRSQIINGIDVPAVGTPELESFITSSSVEVVDGEVTFQVPLLYGTAGAGGTASFTTLRSLNLAAGTNEFSVTDLWTSSNALKNNLGAVVVPAGAKVPLADLVAFITAQGNVTVLGSGVQTEYPAVVSTITSNNVETTFAPIVVPVPTDVRVTEAEIAPNEDVYVGWHEGYDNPSNAYSVDEDGLNLGDGAHSQIIKGLAAPQTVPSVGILINGASVVVVDGEVTYQVPIFYGAGTDFTTLRSESLDAGTHTFDLTSQWTASSSFGDIVSGQYYALGDILDDLTNVRVLAFGVQTEAPATVQSITFDGVRYSFDGPITAGVPTITGTAKVGETLTANAGTWAPDVTDFDYQWKANGTDIPGATGSTYDLTADEVGKIIVVEVTGNKPGYSPVSAISSGAGPVVAGDLSVGTPIITGAPQIGSELTAEEGTWGPGTVDFSYQWLRDGVAIAGADDRTYTTTIADVGLTISVEVTGSADGYNDQTATSAGVVIQGSAIVVIEPSISGTPQVDQVLTANPGTWLPNTTTFEYQWRVAGIEVVGATASTYTPTAADVGKDVTVTVTGTAPNATPASVTSDSVGPVTKANLMTATPTISGTPTVGETLTGNAGAWGPVPVTFGYQWQADGTDIAGATGTSLILTAAEEGKAITLVVTGTKPGYNDASVESAATADVAEGDLTSAVPTITGTPQVGAVLTAVPGTWAPAGVTFSYQWQVDGADVGTDSSTYTPVAADAGKTVTVEVTGSLDGYGDETVESAPTAVVLLGSQTGTVTFTGTLRFGETLTAVETGWDGATLTYEWFADGVTTGSGSTYELDAADVGKQITVKVTAVRAGYTDAVLTSAPQGPVVLAPMSPAVPTISDTSPHVGDVLSVTVGTWAPTGVAFTYQWLADGVAIPGATGTTYTVVAGNIGDAISVRVSGTKAGYTPTSSTSAATAVVANGTVVVDRLSGTDRYAVGVSVSQALFPNPGAGVPVVYLANGADFPDALSAAPAAVHEGGPLLLTRTEALPTDVRNEIIRLNPDQVVISGGPASVSQAVFNDLVSIVGVGNVIRLGGDDRYEVSRNVIENAWDVDSESFPVLYVTTGVIFPDALSASPAAAHVDAPVLLVPGTSGSLDNATKALLAEMDPTTIKVAGGSVSNAILVQLSVYGSVQVLGGADRYVASQTINADAFSSSEHVYLTTGLNFPDGLVGAALAGAKDAPLFTVPPTCVPAAVLAAINNLGATKVHLLGGPATLNGNVFALGQCP